MKIKLLKKNNPLLRSRRDGRGFYGRVFVLGVSTDTGPGIDHKFVVLQNARKGPKTTAVLTYCDADLFAMANETERFIDVVQRHYLKKYNQELLFIKTYVSLHGFTENGKVHELTLLQIDKQTKLFDETGGRANIALTEDVPDTQGAAPARTC